MTLRPILILIGFALTLLPIVARADVGSERFGGFEDCTSYGEWAGKTTPKAAQVYEALVVARAPSNERHQASLVLVPHPDGFSGPSRPRSTRNIGDTPLPPNVRPRSTRNEYEANDTGSPYDWNVDQVDSTVCGGAPEHKPAPPAPNAPKTNVCDATKLDELTNAYMTAVNAKFPHGASGADSVWVQQNDPVTLTSAAEATAKGAKSGDYSAACDLYMRAIAIYNARPPT
jgi:hypothetical protein